MGDCPPASCASGEFDSQEVRVSFDINAAPDIGVAYSYLNGRIDRLRSLGRPLDAQTVGVRFSAVEC
jgi:hypothetical protein